MKIIMNNEYRMVFHLKPFLKMWFLLLCYNNKTGVLAYVCVTVQPERKYPFPTFGEMWLKRTDVPILACSGADKVDARTIP